jgi:UDP-glucuronate 4-epimerase
MIVLVTGGAGFIGSHVTDRLVARGDRVVCFDNFDGFYSRDVKQANLAGARQSGLLDMVDGDIRDADLCRDVLSRFAVDAVIHLAARAGVRPSIESPAAYEEVNCLGTINLLEAMREAGVGRLVFGSSSSVYGTNAKVPFSEDDPVTQPISPYAATKRAGELMCHVYHHLYGVSVACLRFFTVYGPRQRPDLAIHKFARLIAEGRPIPVYGDGSARRDYTYCTDIVDGVVAALDADLGYEILNLGNGHPVELRALIALIEEHMGTAAIIERLPDQPGDVPITYADISKATRLLGYGPNYPIGQGIAEFVQWLKETSGGTGRS